MPPRKTIPMKSRKAAPPAVRRPGVVTEEQKVQFLVTFQDTFSVVEAAAEADISGRDLKQAFSDDPEFHETYRSIRTGQGEKVQKAMIDRALKGDPACARIVLPALLPDLYGNRVTIDINVNRPEDLQKVDDDKLDEIEKTCLKLQNSSNG